MIKTTAEHKKELLQRPDITYILKNDDINTKIEKILGVRKEIWDTIDNNEYKKYPEGHIFDEDKSVKWNKEEVERKNKEYKDRRQDIRNLYSAFESIISDAIIEYIMWDCNILNEHMARIVYNAAYEDSHSSGYYETIQFVDQYLDVFNELKRAEKE